MSDTDDTPKDDTNKDEITCTVSLGGIKHDFKIAGDREIFDLHRNIILHRSRSYF